MVSRTDKAHLKYPFLMIVSTLLSSTRAWMPTHTLLLCRHGDSIWNGGMSGYAETFTGWTDVPLSAKGRVEAVTAGEQVASYSYHIDICFTSILQRAQETAAYCLAAYEKENQRLIPILADYRLNERHYGALQGLVKQEVEDGKYGHDPNHVRAWRRSWHALPPLLTPTDPRRIHETEVYSSLCGGPENVPIGESLELVAKNRMRPFLDSVLVPMLDQQVSLKRNAASTKHARGSTGLVVAHANSLRALLGVICEVENNPSALEFLESLRIPTGVPLVVQFQKGSGGRYRVSALPEADDCIVDQYFDGPGLAQSAPSHLGHPDLPVWPLDRCIPIREGLHRVAPTQVLQNTNQQ